LFELPQALRSLTPNGLRDDVRVRALALGSGLIPPRTMHSAEDVDILLGAAAGARRVVEIGVYEGASALALIDVLAVGSELHLVEPFGAHADALPGGWGASEWATRRTVARALRRRGTQAPQVRWHIAMSQQVAPAWVDPVDLVFIDGDHSEAGCERDWRDWHGFVAVGGHVVLHDARADMPGGRGLPGPTAVAGRVRERAGDAWQVVAEADRTVAFRRAR
jgi:predicted O-methyltransferase YrrM